MAWPPSNPANFCDKCGRSLVELNVPHVKRKCQECGKTIHLVEPGEGGEGIKVEAGDQFVIPAGFIRMSLDPAASSGRLSRPGVTWLTERFFFDGRPSTPGDAVPSLQAH